MHSMSFRDMGNGVPIFYGSAEPSYDELISALPRSHNRQYQWLLAEAFELFEDFLVDAYGCAAAIDPAIWDPQHLKQVGDSGGRAPAWWVEQARLVKPAPSATVVLRRLRAMPSIRSMEESNWRGFDYKFGLALIERMRHVIVHGRGRVESVEKFATGVGTATGRLVAGAPTAEDMAFIKQYFGDGRLNTTICLLDHQLPSKGPWHVHIDMLDELIGDLMSYAHMLSYTL